MVEIIKEFQIQLIKIFQYFSTLLMVCWLGSSPLFESFSKTVEYNTIVPDIKISRDSIVLIPEKGQWYYRNVPFSGQSISHHENGRMSENIGYYEGRKEGKAEFWYPDGTIRKEAFYKKNRLDGVLKVWSPHSYRTLVKESHYVNGVTHGIQKLWYSNGQIFKKTTIVNGKEQGLQQAWRENGILYINYEAKNGRAFGLKRASLCYQLKKEDVQYE